MATQTQALTCESSSASRKATRKCSTCCRPRTCRANGRTACFRPISSSTRPASTRTLRRRSTKRPTGSAWRNCATRTSLRSATRQRMRSSASHASALEDSSSVVGRLLTAVREHSGMTLCRDPAGGRARSRRGLGRLHVHRRRGRVLQRAHGDDVWELLSEHADDMGMTPLALVASFNSAEMVEDAASLGTLLRMVRAGGGRPLPGRRVMKLGRVRTSEHRDPGPRRPGSRRATKRDPSVGEGERPQGRRVDVRRRRER